MTWPGSPGFGTGNVDAGSDAPANARADFFNALTDLANVINGRGQASGVASLDAGSKIPSAQVPITPINAAASPFVTSTPGASSWTVPAGVERIKVRIAAGGGGGGYTSIATAGDHGGGGGAGGYAEKSFTVVAGSVFNFTMGAKGIGAPITSDGVGTDGDNSAITSPASATPASHTVTCNGGLGGEGGVAGTGSRFGGGGGASFNGDVSLDGGAGVSGATRGGAGGSNALSGNAAGGVLPGGGGGAGSGGGTPGFDGRDGLLIIEW